MGRVFPDLKVASKSLTTVATSEIGVHEAMVSLESDIVAVFIPEALRIRSARINCEKVGIQTRLYSLQQAYSSAGLETRK